MTPLGRALEFPDEMASQRGVQQYATQDWDAISPFLFFFLLLSSLQHAERIGLHPYLTCIIDPLLLLYKSTPKKAAL
jgi:hypothetical protein